MAALSTLLQTLLRKAGWFAAVGLALLVIVELGLWIFAPVSKYPIYSFNFKNEMKPFGLGESSLFEIDGREVRHRNAPKGRDELNVLILGGEGSYQPLQNVDETWWGRMALELESQFPEVGLEISTRASPSGARASGTAMRHALRWAKAYADEIDPDVIVVSFGLSEVLDILPGYRYNPTAMQMLPAAAKSSSLKDLVAGFSQIARRVRNSRKLSSDAMTERRALLEEPNHFLTNLARQRAVYESMPFDAQPPIWTMENDPKSEYLDGLRAFQALAKRLGAELVVLAEPTVHHEFLGFEEMGRLNRPRWSKRPTVEDPTGSGFRPDPGWVHRELQRYYSAAESWAAEKQVPFVNLNRETVLAKKVTNFVDDDMLTNEGSQRMADEVAPSIAFAIKKVLAK